MSNSQSSLTRIILEKKLCLHDFVSFIAQIRSNPLLETKDRDILVSQLNVYFIELEKNTTDFINHLSQERNSDQFEQIIKDLLVYIKFANFRKDFINSLEQLQKDNQKNAFAIEKELSLIIKSVKDFFGFLCVWVEGI